MANALAEKYSAAIRARGGLRGALRKYGLMRLCDAALRERWETLGMRLLSLLGRGPGRGYGWLEAILSPTCDYWLRYAHIIAALETTIGSDARRLAEVSSGGRGGIAWALGRTDKQICLVDWSEDLLGDRRGGDAWRACADACRLPFADNSFDAVVSLDTLEHLPSARRAPFLEELKRVARRAVLVTCPLQSADGFFQGRDFDFRLSQEIETRKGVQPGWLQEHMQQGHPTREEISQLLPHVQIMGSENCEVWLRFELLYQTTFAWLFSALYYVLVLQKRDTGPPYRRATMVWQKPHSIEENNAASARDLQAAGVLV